MAALFFYFYSSSNLLRPCREEVKSMEYTDYGVVWFDGVERVSDSWDEVEDEEEEAD